MSRLGLAMSILADNATSLAEASGKCALRIIRALDDPASLARSRATAFATLHSGGNPNFAEDVYGASLAHLIDAGQPDIVLLMLQAGADPNIKSYDVATDENNDDYSYVLLPLNSAVICGDIEIVDALLKNGANPNASTGNGTHAAHHLSQIRHRDTAVSIGGLLISYGADVNARDGSGHTPLMVAAGHNRFAATQALLELGASSSARSRSGETARDIAYRLDAQRALRILDDWSAHNQTNTHNARANRRVAAYLGPPYFSSPRRLTYELRSAIQDGRDSRGILTAIAAGAAPNEFLGSAVRAERLDLVATLLDAGADPNYEEWEYGDDPYVHTPLKVAVIAGNAKMVACLLNYGANPLHGIDESGGVALHYISLVTSNAAAIQIATSLTAHGVDIDIRDNDGWTPLMGAADRNNPAAINALLHLGASLDATNKEGKTALEIALEAGRADAAPALRAWKRPTPQAVYAELAP